MAFNFGEVLTRAWQITWNHKVLWVFGLLGMLLSLLFLPLGFAPALSIFMSEDIPIWMEEPVYIIGYFGLFAVLMVMSFFVGTLIQAAVSCGVLRAEREAKKIGFVELLRSSIPYFGRFLGIMALLMGGIILVMVGFFALQIIVSMLTFGLGAMCLVPLQFLFYPLMMVSYAWLEQALASIVVDEYGVFEAARQGWQVFRKNLLPVVLMTLIMYLGIGMVSGFVSIPLMVPFFAVPFVLIEGLENTRIVLWAVSLCALAYMPVLAVFQAVAMTFMKSGWILTYLRLTRKTETSVPVAPAA